ncbi:thiamine diphosphokinase [Bacillus tuaregi]|uniref:thiamine diphosphokinase n=1 Tax=Bacillus tuaregi TaxID=1816695 RepID=UPI0008F913FD|nr:thiamine diphosphokinase [Bacillus tuaregi]
MIIHLIGGGPDNLLPDLSFFQEQNIIWAGVDRGVYTLIEHGIKPDIAFGDFDSVTEMEYSIIKSTVTELNQYQPEKDETDMEHALKWAIKQEPHIIRMFGTTGGRLDHMFGNIQLLMDNSMNYQDIHIEMIDVQNTIFIRPPGEHTLQKVTEKKYISFIPLTGEVKGITLTGFKYPLYNRHISIGSTLCISNELLGDSGTFSFSKGILMIVRSTD